MTDAPTTRPDAEPTRRTLLRFIGIVGAGSAAMATAIAVPRAAVAKPHGAGRHFVVYRLSPRGTRSCKACTKHHRRFAYLTHALANANRAHKGCNCPIDTQQLHRNVFRRLFPEGGTGIADLGAVARRKRA
jgi:hypothetical protein